MRARKDLFDSRGLDATDLDALKNHYARGENAAIRRLAGYIGPTGTGPNKRKYSRMPPIIMGTGGGSTLEEAYRSEVIGKVCMHPYPL